MTGRRQPQRIPPPIDHGSERIDAEPVLREYPGDQGLVLWKTVRSVRLWTDLSPARRGTAFRADAHERRMALLESAVEDAEMRADLVVAAGVLLGDEAEAQEIAGACKRIGDRASGAGLSATALQFTQAAAFASPSDASLAYAVASLSLNRAENARGETWCRRTMSVARRTRDWKYFVYALLALGAVHRTRGNLPLGRKLVRRAVRVAKRYSQREALGHAYAALIGVSHQPKPSELERWARAALEAFGPGHLWLPGLAHNVAMQWMEAGFFGPALTVFLRIPHDYLRPEAQLGMGANTARAAAAVGDLETYRAARARSEALLDNPAAQASAAVSLVNLARAALLA